MSSDEQRGTLSPGRLEAFSDGVIAVIITIMVLELKVPHASGLAGLREILPTLAIYALSFVFVGIYWVNHHLLIARARSVDSLTLYSNLVFLFFLSLLPFFTAWVLEKDRATLSVQLYTGSLIASGTAFMLLRLSVERRLRLEHRHASEDTRTRAKHWVSLALYFAGFALALVHPSFALVLDAAVTLTWVMPGLALRHTPLAAQ